MNVSYFKNTGYILLVFSKQPDRVTGHYYPCKKEMNHQLENQDQQTNSGTLELVALNLHKFGY